MKNRFLLLCFSLLLFSACNDDNNDPEPSNEPNAAEVRMEMANAVLNQKILPAYESLSQEAASFNSQLLAYSQGSQDLESVRTQLKSYWTQWQRTSLYLFGPATVANLRSTLNTYPVDNEKIDSKTSDANPSFGSLDMLDAQGFAALDYLLNTRESHNAEELRYLSLLADYMLQAIEDTYQEWKTGDYVDNFTSQDANGTDVGSSLGIMVNAMDLHFQRFVRDGKIAIPAGIRSAGIIRPQSVEAYYGQYSTDLLAASIAAYHDYFMGVGTETANFKSYNYYLEEVLEQEELANQIDQVFKKLKSDIAQLDTHLSQQIDTDIAPVTEIFLSMQDLVSLFKSDMASVMGISITNQDNDGD